jgi:hypothetical protein
VLWLSGVKVRLCTRLEWASSKCLCVCVVRLCACLYLCVEDGLVRPSEGCMPGRMCSPDGYPVLKQARSHLSSPTDGGVARLKKNRPGPLHHSPKRVATLDALRALDNCLRAGLCRRLHEWKYTNANHHALSDALDKRKLTRDLLALHGGHLVVTSDKGPSQFAMKQFLMWHCQVRAVFFWDPMAHGLWNACKMGLKQAGFFTTLLESQILVNWRAGLVKSFHNGVAGGGI